VDRLDAEIFADKVIENLNLGKNSVREAIVETAMNDPSILSLRGLKEHANVLYKEIKAFLF
jgi:hypothetical protein